MIEEKNIIMPSRITPDFFTWDLAYDWSVSNGNIRMSGEDLDSALSRPTSGPRTPRERESKRHDPSARCLSETPGGLPLFGPPSDEPKIHYLVGLPFCPRHHDAWAPRVPCPESSRGSSPGEMLHPPLLRRRGCPLRGVYSDRQHTSNRPGAGVPAEGPPIIRGADCSPAPIRQRSSATQALLTISGTIFRGPHAHRARPIGPTGSALGHSGER